MRRDWTRWAAEALFVLICAAALYRLVPPTSEASSAAPNPLGAAGETALAGAVVGQTSPAPELPLAASAEIAVDPAPPAQPGRAAAIEGWRGSGEGETAARWLEPGLYLFAIRHRQATPFAIFLLGEGGEHLALLANATAPISGSQAYGVTVAGQYHLHIIGQDAWEVDVAAAGVAPKSSPAPFAQADGTGMQVIGPFSFAAGMRSFAWTHSGALGFTAALWSGDGARRIELVNTNGPAAGGGSVAIPAAGAYFLMVMADGDWTVR